jgi:hypothetical protein
MTPFVATAFKIQKYQNCANESPYVSSQLVIHHVNLYLFAGFEGG